MPMHACVSVNAHVCLPGLYEEGLCATEVMGQVLILLPVSWAHHKLPKECHTQVVLTES